MGVISVRLKDRDMERLEELSRGQHKDKSAVARELLEYGWDFLMFKSYKEGKLSLTGFARKLDITEDKGLRRLSDDTSSFLPNPAGPDSRSTLQQQRVRSESRTGI